MIAYTQRAGIVIIFISLLLASVCYSTNTKLETTTITSPSKTITISENSDQKDSSGEAEETSISSGIFPIGELHEVVRKERIDALLEINKQRKATLAYLTDERRAITEELKTELNRIAALVKSERRATMLDIEVIGNRIVENAILNSERLIDHFFIRMMQFSMIITVGVIILGFVVFRIVEKRRSQS